MTTSVVLDANVVVSAQLVQHPLAPSFRVFEACSAGRLQAYISPALLEEYLEVLTRPSLSRRHLLSESEVHEMVGRLVAPMILVQPPRASVDAPDARDQHLWNLLASFPDLVLVTGDPPLLRSAHFPGRVLSPRQFVERYLDD